MPKALPLLLMVIAFAVSSAWEVAAWGPRGDAMFFEVTDSPSQRLDRAVRWCMADPQLALPPADCTGRAPRMGSLNAGYSKLALWVAVDLERARSVPGALLLDIDYPSLDRVEVFDPARPGTVLAVLGDTLPFAAKTLSSRSLTVPIDIPEGRSTLWLRVESRASLTVPLALWRPSDFAVHERSGVALYAAYYGLVVGLALFYLLLAVGVRDLTFGFYSAYALALGLGLAARNGMGAQYLWPHAPALSQHSMWFGVVATIVLGSVVVIRFLNLRERGGWTLWGINVLVACSVLVALPGIFIQAEWAWPLLSVCMLGLCVTAVVASVSAVRRRVPAARPFLIAWAFLSVGVVGLALRNLGVLPTNFWTNSAIELGSSAELLMLALALAARFALLRDANQHAQSALLLMQRRALAASALAEQRLEQRVFERTGELEAANRSLRDSEARLRDMTARDGLTGLSNRAGLRTGLEAAITRWRLGGRPPAVLLLDLDGFKPVNDRHGHAVGDLVLVEIARRLQRAVNDGDEVARHGGDEFVVLMHDAGDAAGLEARVARVADALAEPITLEEFQGIVGASIGVAEVASAVESSESLLRRADMAMYQAKASGSGRWAYAPRLPG